jgi:hypothetical protein
VWRSAGYASADAYVWAQPIRALYAGAGHLDLPIEAALRGEAPGVLGTGGEYSAAAVGTVPKPPSFLTAPSARANAGASKLPLYTCNASWADPADGSNDGSGGGWRTSWAHWLEPPPQAASAGEALFRLLTTDCSDDEADVLPCLASGLGWAEPLAAPTSFGGSSVARTAFASYAYCMAACNKDTLAPLWRLDRLNASVAAITSAGGRSSGVNVTWSGVDAWCSNNGGGYTSGGYPFFIESPHATTAAVADGTCLSGDTPAPAAACWLPSPCVAFSTASARDQRARVSAAYDRYIDVIMSEAMRGGASLEVSTPLQVCPRVGGQRGSGEAEQSLHAAAPFPVSSPDPSAASGPSHGPCPPAHLPCQGARYGPQDAGLLLLELRA